MPESELLKIPTNSCKLHPQKPFLVYFISFLASNDSEDMHIDILQVHDTSGADSDFSCKDECNSLPNQIPIASDLLQGDLQTPPPTSTTTTAPSSSSPSSTNSHREDMLWWRETLNLDKVNLTLMGFSKGCVVLNQVRKMKLKIFLLFSF